MGDKDLKKMLRHAKDYIEQSLGPRCDTIMSEVAIAINWSSGDAKVLDGVKNREYPDLGPQYQCGTADLVCVLKTGELLVADWKTGGTDGANEQLMSLACGFQKAMPSMPDVQTDTETLAYPRGIRIACLRVDNDGVDADERPVSDDALAAHWVAMEMVWEGKDGKTSPVPGIHCTQLYCPHLAYCSAISAIVEQTAAEDVAGGDDTSLIPPGSLLKKKFTDSPRNDDEAGFVMAMVAAGRRQLKYYENIMRERIANGGRVVTGNYEWKETGSGFRWTRIGR